MVMQLSKNRKDGMGDYKVNEKVWVLINKSVPKETLVSPLVQGKFPNFDDIPRNARWIPGIIRSGSSENGYTVKSEQNTEIVDDYATRLPIYNDLKNVDTTTVTPSEGDTIVFDSTTQKFEAAAGIDGGFYGS